jgi:acetyl esterase/lipase
MKSCPAQPDRFGHEPIDSGPLPILVYFHGGGWVMGDLDVYDGGPRGLAHEARCIVISVDYRRAPEARFPAAWDDAMATWRWISSHGRNYGGDSQLALGGESDGACLALATAIAASRDAGLSAPVHVLAVYPLAQTGSLATPSYIEDALAQPLSRAMMPWFFDKLLRSEDDLRDTRLDVVHADLHGLPPVTIVSAMLDPLRSDGAMLEDALLDAGVPVVRRDYHGVTHEFFAAAAVVAKAREAQRSPWNACARHSAPADCRFKMRWRRTNAGKVVPIPVGVRHVSKHPCATCASAKASRRLSADDQSNRAVPAGKSAHRWSPDPAEDQRNDEQDQENEKDELGDVRRGSGDAGETERCGNQRDDQEYEGPCQHGGSPWKHERLALNAAGCVPLGAARGLFPDRTQASADCHSAYGKHPRLSKKFSPCEPFSARAHKALQSVPSAARSGSARSARRYSAATARMAHGLLLGHPLLNTDFRSRRLGSAATVVRFREQFFYSRGSYDDVRTSPTASARLCVHGHKQATRNREPWRPCRSCAGNGTQVLAGRSPPGGPQGRRDGERKP